MKDARVSSMNDLCLSESVADPSVISWVVSGSWTLPALFSRCLSSQTRLHTGSVLPPHCSWGCGYCLCACATAPPPLLAELHFLLPVSVPKLLPCICLILCKAQVFLCGLLSRALTSTRRANETTALQWSNDTVDLF